MGIMSAPFYPRVGVKRLSFYTRYRVVFVCKGTTVSRNLCSESCGEFGREIQQQMRRHTQTTEAHCFNTVTFLFAKAAALTSWNLRQSTMGPRRERKGLIN